MRGDKECPFSGVTKSGRVRRRKVPESDARSVDRDRQVKHSHLMPCRSTISSASTHAHSITTKVQMAMRTGRLLITFSVRLRHLQQSSSSPMLSSSLSSMLSFFLFFYTLPWLRGRHTGSHRCPTHFPSVIAIAS